MTPAQKEWIDNASYEAMLTRWRFAPAGDSIFQGEAGEYYRKVMADKRPSDAEHAAASKRVGW